MRLLHLGMLICVTFASIGCAVKAIAPGPILETPTISQSDFAWGIGMGGRPAQQVKITSDYTARPLDLSKRWTTTVHEFYFGPNIGYKRFELSWDIALVTGGALRLKYQALGPALKDAKKGDWTAVVGVQSTSGGRSQSSGTKTESSNDRLYKTSASLAGLGFALSGGYFVSDNIQLYAGHTHIDYTLTYKIEQEASGSDPQEIYEGREDGWTSTTGLGLQQVFGDNRTHAFHANVQYRRRPWRLAEGGADLVAAMGLHWSF